MDDAELKDFVYQEHAKIFRGLVLEKGLGNYTKSYEFYKRITNVEQLFCRAAAGRKTVAALDIGCGNGYHLARLNNLQGVKERSSFIGIEINPHDLAMAKRLAESMSCQNILFKLGSAEQLDFTDASFDVVTCTDVIEHIPNPLKCLQESFRVLRPGGTLILTTPNDSSAVKWLGAFIQRKKSTPPVMGTEHISVYGYGKWLKVIRQSGFRIRSTRRGALLFGGDRYNRHPVVFAFVILLDKLFDILPFTNNWCEALTFELRKSIGN